MLEILQLIILTLLPALELRASIPYGILVLNMGWVSVFLICIITNIILGILLYQFIDVIMNICLKIGFLRRFYHRYVSKTQSSIRKYVERYGNFGVAIFIGIPLPGSGVYSGSLGAYLIGMKFKSFILANIIGVIIAGVIVTLVTISGSTAFGLFIK